MRHDDFGTRGSLGAVQLMMVVSLLCGTIGCGGGPAGPSATGGGSSGGGSTGGGGGAPSLSPGMMTATVDGVPWTGRINVASIATGNSLVMTGETGIGTPSQILLSISTPARAGTENVGSGLVVGTYVTAPTVNWLAAGPTGSGTVTVTTFTQTAATGTFSFVMAPGAGTTTTKVVTAGAFNVRIPTP
jgi:hypothetical protein